MLVQYQTDNENSSHGVSSLGYYSIHVGVWIFYVSVVSASNSAVGIGVWESIHLSKASLFAAALRGAT